MDRQNQTQPNTFMALTVVLSRAPPKFLSSYIYLLTAGERCAASSFFPQAHGKLLSCTLQGRDLKRQMTLVNVG